MKNIHHRNRLISLLYKSIYQWISTRMSYEFSPSSAFCGAPSRRSRARRSFVLQRVGYVRVEVGSLSHFYRVSYISGGAGFQSSTVLPPSESPPLAVLQRSVPSVPPSVASLDLSRLKRSNQQAEANVWLFP